MLSAVIIITIITITTIVTTLQDHSIQLLHQVAAQVDIVEALTARAVVRQRRDHRDNRFFFIHNIFLTVSFIL